MRFFSRQANKTKKPVSAQTLLLRKQILIGFILVVLISALVSLIGYVTRLPSLQIKEIQVVGGVTIPHQQITEIAKDALAGTYARLIPKRFVWTYPKDYVTEQILNLDRVKNVQLELNKNKDLIIGFEEHIPHGLWCSSVESSDCLFIDVAGLAFAKAPSLNGGAFVRYVTNEEPVINSYVTEKEFLDEAEGFIEGVESELGLFVTHVVELDDVDVDYYVSGGGRIRVSQSISADRSFANLRLILASEDFAHIEPGTFNYIDLRFGDKVFVNEVKDEVFASSTASTSALNNE